MAVTRFFIFLTIIIAICAIYLASRNKREAGPVSLYFYCLLSVCLSAHFTFALSGWNYSISDMHGFRQTQTAISTYYMLKEGFRLDYITPILGKPWSIPMEFPLYQWIVAIFVKVTGIGLDQGGRTISLLFFYLSLIAVYRLLSSFVVRKEHRLVFICLLLASPVYIFWSRTFMIESLALFLSMTFLVTVRTAGKKTDLYSLLIAVAVGVLAGLVKVTTFLVFCLPAAVIFGVSAIKGSLKADFRGQSLLRYVMFGFILFGAPLLLSALWVCYADSIKAMNPLGEGLRSSALGVWNFGTIGQRLSMDMVKSIYDNMFRVVCGNNTLSVYDQFRHIMMGCGVVSVIYLVIISKYRYIVLWCFIFFLAGPFLFANLYIVHSYYWYANGIFLLLSLGSVIVSLLESPRWGYAAKAFILPALLLSMYSGYWSNYYPVQAYENRPYQGLLEAVDRHTEEDDILLICGADWSSEIPYYSKRRALMDWGDLPFNSEKFQAALKKLGDDRISAMVVLKRRGEGLPPDLIREQVEGLNLFPDPVYENKGEELYLSRERHEK